MYIGIDLGTSGVKVILMAQDGNVVASCSSPLSVSRPFDLWSEQNPEDWWQVTDLAMLAIGSRERFTRCKSHWLIGPDAWRYIIG